MTEEAETSKPERRERWSGPGHEAYANAVMVSPGPFDVALVFGQQDVVRGPNAEGRFETREVVRVSMSWGHLKSMVPLLAKMVARYEQEFGELPAPGFNKLWKE